MGDYNGALNSGINQNGDDMPLENALLNLMNRTGYNMIQENGQRKLGPPPNWNGPPPPKGSEIFVGKIPRDVFENDLFPVFEQVGPIYEMRLMMDFSGSNRGYAFVTYTNVEDAKKAISQLNNYQIRPGKYLGIVKSVDNCRLFVGYIPKTKTKEEIKEEISKVTDGVVDVILYNSPHDKAKNRGFAFIEYDSHRAAAIARRKLLPGRILLWNQHIQVDWAEPEPEVDDDVMATVRVLYVRNLMESTTEETLKKLFEENRPRSVEKVKKLRDFAFVHFISRPDAEDAKERLNNTDLDGSTIVVTWAKPIDRSNRFSPRRGGYYNYNNSFNSPNRYSLAYNDVQSAGMDAAAPVPYSIAQAGHIIAYQGTPNARRGVGNFGSNAPSFRGRGGRGAAGLRGGRTYLAAAVTSRISEFPYFDFPHGYSLIQPNPMPYIRKSPYQILTEFCQKRGFGDPQFQVIPCTSSINEGGPNITLYQGKVVIPNWGDYTASRTFRSTEEAKFYTAAGVLSQMNPTWEGSEMQPYYEISQPPAMFAVAGCPPVGPTANF